MSSNQDEPSIIDEGFEVWEYWEEVPIVVPPSEKEFLASLLDKPSLYPRFTDDETPLLVPKESWTEDPPPSEMA